MIHILYLSFYNANTCVCLTTCVCMLVAVLDNCAGCTECMDETRQMRYTLAHKQKTTTGFSAIL